MAVPETISRVRDRTRTHRLAPWGSAIEDSKNGWLCRLLAWGATSDSKQEAARLGVWRVRLVRLFPPPLLSFFAVCVCNRVDFAVVLFAPSRGLSVCVVAIRRGVLHSTGLTGARPGCVAGLCGGRVGSSTEKALIVRPTA